MQNLLSKTFFITAACIAYPLTIFAAAAQPIMPFKEGQLPIEQLNTIANINHELTDRNFGGCLSKTARNYLKAKDGCSKEDILCDLNQWKSKVKLRMGEGCQTVATDTVQRFSDNQVINLARLLEQGAPLSLLFSDALFRRTRKINIQQANCLFHGYSAIEDQCLRQTIGARAQEIRSRAAQFKRILVRPQAIVETAEDARINEKTASVARKCAIFVLRGA